MCGGTGRGGARRDLSRRTPVRGGRAPRGSHAARKTRNNNLTLSAGASPRVRVMPAWREPPRHSIYDANTLNQKQRRASTKSTLLSCAAESANLPAQQRSETALAWGCWPLAAEQAASQRSPVQPCVPSPGAARRRCSPSNRAQRRCCHCCCCYCCRCQLHRKERLVNPRACPASDTISRQLNSCRW